MLTKKELPKIIKCTKCGKEFNSNDLDELRLKYNQLICNDCYKIIREVMSGESGKIIIGQIYYSLKKSSNQLGINDDDEEEDEDEE